MRVAYATWANPRNVLASHDSHEGVPRIGDMIQTINFGDNHTTIRCQLPPGHEGLHQEAYVSSQSGKVVITWECHDESYDIDALQREIERRIRETFTDARCDYEWVEEADVSRILAPCIERVDVFDRCAICFRAAPADTPIPHTKICLLAKPESGFDYTVYEVGDRKVCFRVIAGGQVLVGAEVFCGEAAGQQATQKILQALGET